MLGAVLLSMTVMRTIHHTVAARQQAVASPSSKYRSGSKLGRCCAVCDHQPALAGYSAFAQTAAGTTLSDKQSLAPGALCRCARHCR